MDDPFRQTGSAFSRRGFVSKLATGVTGLALTAQTAFAQNQEQGQNGGRQSAAVPANAPPRLGLQMNFACTLYDNMLPVYRRFVQPEGLNLDFIIFDNPKDVSDRQSSMAEFDSSEMFVSDYYLSQGYNANFLANGGPFVAIPAFPTHLFHHRAIAINKKSGIQSPKDLEGKRVGVEGYYDIGAIYTRGLLRHEYGVDVDKIHWVQPESGNRKVSLLPNAKAPMIDTNTGGKSLEDHLASHGIDALIDYDLPVGNKNVDLARLFPNFREVEKDYYQRTRIFPVISTVVIRREYYERYPFIARSLYNALNQAKNNKVAEMLVALAPTWMPPFVAWDCDEIKAVFSGGDPSPYGVDANRPALTELGFSMIEDGILPPTPIDTFFVPVTSEVG